MSVSQKKDEILKLLFEISHGYKDFDREKLVKYIAEKYPKKFDSVEIELFLEILTQNEFLEPAAGITIKGKDFHLNGGYSKEAELKKKEVHWLLRAVVIAVIGVSLQLLMTWMTKKRSDHKYSNIYEKALFIDSILNAKIRIAEEVGIDSLKNVYTIYRNRLIPQILNGNPEWILLHADTLVNDLNIIEYELTHDPLK